jgi:hypothetical protein
LRRVLVVRWVFAALCLAHLCFGQSAATGTGTEEKPKLPLTPKEYAQQLLDGVGETAGTADPQVAPFILWRAADAYIALDKAKAASMLEDAFARAAAIPPDARNDPRTFLQVFAATSMTEIDLAKAADMLTRIHVNSDEVSYDQRSSAAYRVIQQHLAAKNIDGAMDFIGALAGGGAYPYSSVQQIIEALEPGDPRRVVLFGNAVAAYQTHPGPDFAKLVGALWKDLPEAQVEAALDSMVAHILSYSDDENNLAISYTTANGIASLPNRQDSELFEIITPLRAYEPDKLNRLLRNHPDLAKALEVLPNGYDRKQIHGASMGSSQKGAGAADSAFLVSSQITAKAMQSLKDAPGEAFDLAKTIPDNAWRAMCYAQMAQRLAATDSARAHQALSLAMDSVEKSNDKYQSLAAHVWDQVIDVASSRLKDDDLAKEAFGRSLATLEGMYRVDSDPENPNIAPVDFWPSTAEYRKSFQAAAKLYGMSASSYFEKIRDRNELLEAEVAFAAELLHRRPAPANTAVSHAKPRKQAQ